jgi:hypothetical protein
MLRARWRPPGEEGFGIKSERPCCAKSTNLSKTDVRVLLAGFSLVGVPRHKIREELGVLLRVWRSQENLRWSRVDPELPICLAILPRRLFLPELSIRIRHSHSPATLSARVTASLVKDDSPRPVLE